ncbi:MAG: glycosyltransferase family 4 protein [Methanocellales archaeon]|nr:glycosyltransferase family 4 protein [Methanocellales archaeon]
MKIMMIESRGQGGVCHYTHNLCNALTGVTKDITLITSKNYELDGLRKKFRIEKLFDANYPFDIIRVFRYLMEEKPEIIHFQMLRAPLVDWVFIRSLKSFSRSKLIYTAHNVIPHHQKLYTKFLLSKIYSLMDNIIVHTKGDERELIDAFELSKPKISTIPHGNYVSPVDGHAPSREEARKELGIPSDIKTVLFFGYISENKGLRYLIEAFKDVVKKVPSKLVIAGKPVEDFSTYESLISKLGITKDVILNLDYIPFDEVGHYFMSADVVVLPYVKPYHSVIAQAAHSFGKPVIVTGSSEVVVDGKSGYVVRPKSSAAIEDAVVKILSDDEMRAEMGCYAKKQAEANSWDKVAEKTMKVYFQKKDGE